MEYIYQNIIAFVALLISIITYLGAKRSAEKYATTGSMNFEIAKLEVEVKKLQEGLDRCIKERIGFKAEISALRKALEVAHIEIEELKDDG